VYFNLRNILPKSGTFLPGHLYLSLALKECEGGVQDISHEVWGTMINSSFWEMKIFLSLGDDYGLKHVLEHYLFLLWTVVLTVLFLVRNVRKKNFMSSVKVVYLLLRCEGIKDLNYVHI